MKKKGNILIIDDNEAMLVSLRMLLKNVCEDVQTSTNPNAIPTLMRRKRPDVVLLDMNFGRGINNGNEGMFWLKEIKRLEPDVAVVLFTAYADIDLAVRGMKEGAADFIVKPFENEVLIEKLSPFLTSPRGGTENASAPDANQTLPLGGDGGGWELLWIWFERWLLLMPISSSQEKTELARRCWLARFTGCRNVTPNRW